MDLGQASTDNAEGIKTPQATDDGAPAPELGTPEGRGFLSEGTRSPTMIAGMHRAGTSMVAKALRLAGLYLGPEEEFVPPAPDNPEGFFEHAGLVRLGEDLLEATGGAWDHVPPCPPMAADDPRVAHLRDRAIELIDRLAVMPHWGWKDPRASLAARFWLDLLPNLKIVVCVRHPLEVALSLKQRNNTSYTHGLTLWSSYYEELLDAVTTERRIVTHFETHFREPGVEAARLVEFLGLSSAGAAEAETAPDADLRHQRLEISLADAGVAPEIIRLYHRLREEVGEPIAATEPVDQTERAARVDRNALELELANQQLERRRRQVASLQRRKTELGERVDELEAAGRGKPLGAIAARVDRLEEAIHKLRYRAQDLAGREDVAALHAGRELVRSHVPRSEPVLVVAKGDPVWLDLYGRPASNFPQDASGRYPGFPFAHSVAAIAHLEALRRRGSDFLLIPEISAWWRDHFAEFTAHLAGRYEVAAEEPGAGVLFDLRTRRADGEAMPGRLSDLIERIAGVCGSEPAVLDWTEGELNGHLSGRKVFTPPAGETLPYLDDTIEAVLLARARPDGADGKDRGRRLGEARRVATFAVVEIEAGQVPTVAAVEWISREPPGAGGPRVRVPVATPDPDPAWLDQLEDALADQAEATVTLGSEAWSEAAGEAGMIAIAEQGVVPLPGCCPAVRSTLSEGDAIGAVAVKLLAADGSLEAAGTSVFTDGSWAGIGAGSHGVVAPWHEYVRETCGGTGLFFLSSEAVEVLPGGAVEAGAGTPTSLAASLWAAGLRVVYQPDAAAVRATGDLDTSAAAGTRVAAAWSPALASRPSRPDSLDETTWQALVARDDVGAGWAVSKPR